eukprot:5102718-Amphidinium_carterae.1
MLLLEKLQCAHFAWLCMDFENDAICHITSHKRLVDAGSRGFVSRSVFCDPGASAERGIVAKTSLYQPRCIVMLATVVFIK